MEGLKSRVARIAARNRKVEADKAWELSKTRRSLIAVFTYIAIAVYLMAVGIPNPFLNAVVPTAAFMLATLTLPYFKKLWVGHVYRG